MPASWTDRVWLEFRAGNLTRAYRDVLLTLRTYRGHGGLIVSIRGVPSCGNGEGSLSFTA